MPASCSSTYNCGIGTPEAIEISSTTLRRRRSCGSRVCSGTGVPPICSAIAAPPPRRLAMRYSDPRPITATVSTDTAITIAPICPGVRSSLAASAIQTTRSIAQTMPSTAKANRSTRRKEARRAAAWRSKKFMAGTGTGNREWRIGTASCDYGAVFGCLLLSIPIPDSPPFRTAPSALRAPDRCDRREWRAARPARMRTCRRPGWTGTPPACCCRPSPHR